MSLLYHQQRFSEDYANLLSHIHSTGYQTTLGEVHRPSLLQNLYIKLGKSWSKNSQHILKLAGDINLFKGGAYLDRADSHYYFGKYWESLSPYNVWGGRFKDGNHYERRHDVVRAKRLGGKYAKSL